MDGCEIFRDLGMTLPLFQAPIGSVASPELVAAVSSAGGIGQLACTWRSAEQIGPVLDRVHQLTSKAFGANFVLGFDFDGTLGTVLERGVRCISFFWGDASSHLSRVKSAGSVAIQVVGSTDEAKRAADAGFDLIVAQGREAGGHVRGAMGTMTLLPEVIDAVGPLPVIAAGGVADARGVAAAFALGASGVWVGTRFLASLEADIHPIYRASVLEARGEDTVHSELFDIGWSDAPLRTVRNSTVSSWESAGRPCAGQRPGEGEVVAHRADGTAIPRYHFASPTRSITGNVEAMALYCGEAAGLVRTVKGAAEIVHDLSQGFPTSSLERLRAPDPAA